MRALSSDHRGAPAIERGRRSRGRGAGASGAPDHRALGDRLGLFSWPRGAAGGAVWHPEGLCVLRELEALLRDEHRADGYAEVRTPLALEREARGGLGRREAGAFTSRDGEGELALRVDACSGHALLFASRTRSHRELPLRWLELGPAFRPLPEGVRHGLAQAPTVTAEEGHVFCAREDAAAEVRRALARARRLWRALGLTPVRAELATRPDRPQGAREAWAGAEELLGTAARDEGLAPVVQAGEGDASGPRLDLAALDAWGRAWTCFSIRVEVALPAQLGLSYRGPDGRARVPSVLHHTTVESCERLLALLLEHWGGLLPLWLAPEQVRVLPVGGTHVTYALEVARRLTEAGLRVAPDPAHHEGPLAGRVRQAAAVPYVVVVGGDEVAAGAVSVRARGRSERPARLELDALVARLRDEVRERRLTPDLAARRGDEDTQEPEAPAGRGGRGPLANVHPNQE